MSARQKQHLGIHEKRIARLVQAFKAGLRNGRPFLFWIPPQRAAVDRDRIRRVVGEAPSSIAPTPTEWRLLNAVLSKPQLNVLKKHPWKTVGWNTRIKLDRSLAIFPCGGGDGVGVYRRETQRNESAIIIDENKMLHGPYRWAELLLLYLKSDPDYWEQKFRKSNNCLQIWRSY